MFGSVATAAFYLTLLCFASPYAAAALVRRGKCPNSGKSAADTRCCVFYEALEEVQKELFSGGKCDEVAHDALRLTFHDAIGWSRSRKEQGLFPGGGADGSIMKFDDIELNYPGNVGLDETVHEMKPIADKYQISYGDFIQFAGAVSVRNCRGGPRLEFFAGRPDAVEHAPNNGLLPDAADSVDIILDRMADANFSPDELVDLLASHSIGFQEHVDKSIEFTPFDSSVEIMDSQFYLDTLLKGTVDMGQPGLKPAESLSPIPGEFRLQSDAAIARDRRTSCRWQKYAINNYEMQINFKRAMAKLAVVGHKKGDLYDCSEVIPQTKFNNLLVPLSVYPFGKGWKDMEVQSCPNAVSKLVLRTTLGVSTSLVKYVPKAFGN